MHDYEPSWDYPVVELDTFREDLGELVCQDIETIIKKTKEKLLPLMGFEGAKVFFVEQCGFGAPRQGQDPPVAVYCNGTASLPVVGLDLYSLQWFSEKYECDFLRQVEISLVHELGHAYQESCGLDDDHEDGFDEDDAEEFARDWVDTGEANLRLLDPAWTASEKLDG